jgi:hypothetical protein
MKRIILVVGLVFSLGACLPFSVVTNPTPAVDVAATNQANLQTSVAQTLTAQPTFTSVPPSPTLEVLATPGPAFTDTPAESPTAVIADTPVASTTFDVATATNATSGSDSLTAAPALAAGQVTATWTLAVRTYGTLPPRVSFAHITLINKAKAEAYISLHVDLDGSNTVIEYPVKGTVSIQAPLGFYRYVAWVGGREMVGEFRLKKDQDLTIILYKDRVEVK